MKQSTAKGTFFFFYLYIIPAVLLNVVFVFYPLVVEGIIIGDRGVSSRQIDFWISNHYLGGYNRDAYVTFLLEFYILTAVMGFLASYLLVGRPIGSLLKRNEITIGSRRLAIILAGIIIVPAYTMLFGFDQILAFALADPNPLNSFTSSSLLSIYVLTGFFTGVAILMASLPLRAFRKSQRESVALWAKTLKAESANGRKLPTRIQWIFEKKPTSN